MKTKTKTILALLLVAVLLVGCTAETHPVIKESITHAEPKGFLYGLWHGYISLFTFIVSLFNPDVAVYEFNNSGGWYNFGFIFGIAMAYGSSRKAVKEKTKTIK